LTAIEGESYAPYLEACREHRLVVQSCGNCGKHRWPPRPVCAVCGSLEITWVEVCGEGVLYSWTIVHRAADLRFADRVPYVVGVVALAEDPGIRFLGGVVDTDLEELRADLPVVATFRDSGADGVLPYWRARPES
jgi:uncharacterized protein